MVGVAARCAEFENTPALAGGRNKKEAEVKRAGLVPDRQLCRRQFSASPEVFSPPVNTPPNTNNKCYGLQQIYNSNFD